MNRFRVSNHGNPTPPHSAGVSRSGTMDNFGGIGRVQTIDSSVTQEDHADIVSDRSNNPPPRTSTSPFDEEDDERQMVPHDQGRGAPQSPELRHSTPDYPRASSSTGTVATMLSSAQQGLNPCAPTAAPQNYSPAGFSTIAPPRPQRRGHKFGNVIVNGNASLVQGNSFSHINQYDFMADHEYGHVMIGQGATPRILQGDRPTEEVSRFFEEHRVLSGAHQQRCFQSPQNTPYQR